MHQLRESVAAVFRSWNGKRAVDYRTFHKIPHHLGTAANVQMMVFGNMGPDSGTGVAFTRNQVTGAKELYGEYLPNAQGEDVVAGIRTPLKIAELRDDQPELYATLLRVGELLENHFREVQDIEFTVERGKLWMLQTRAAKPPARATVRIALDMVREGLISKEEALLRVEPEHVIHLLLPQFDDKAKSEAKKSGRFLARGLNASPGAAMGIVAFDPDEAEKLGRDERKPVILVRVETSPDDVHGVLHSKGVLTARGGATSHAAVVTRGLGIPCVAGCEEIQVDYDAAEFRVGDKVVRRGESLSIDGSTGEVFAGAIRTIEPDFDREVELQNLLAWADEVRSLQVWANADYPRDAARARKFGAQGIGLDRTEHMFMETDRLPIVHEMILAAPEDRKVKRQREALAKQLETATNDRRRDLEARVAEVDSRLEDLSRRYVGSLDHLGRMQREDFVGILREMAGLPVIIRLIDPPLHEFLPRYETLLVQVTKLRIAREDPEAFVRAATSEEDRMLIAEVRKAGSDLAKGIESLLPRKERLLEAVKGSRETNPLTQTTMGYRRDGAEPKFLLDCVEQGILPHNPFQTIDRDGVGQLMRMCVQKGRKVRRDLEVGICGEHGGDPLSIAFCHEIGLNYVSCSPFRVPVARLAAAHAKLRQEASRPTDR